MSDQNKSVKPQTLPNPQSPTEVWETAAKLALCSAVNNPKSKTGKHLIRFSENIRQKLATNDHSIGNKYNSYDSTQTIKSKESKSPEADLINPIWNIISNTFYSKDSKVIIDVRTNNLLAATDANHKKDTEIVIKTNDNEVRIFFWFFSTSTYALEVKKVS